MSDGKGWFGRGFVKGAYTPPAPNQQQKSDPYNRSRFYLKAGEEKSILLLDGLEDGFRYTEHNIWDTIENRPYYFPCLGAMNKKCWLCEQKSYARNVLALTAIDRAGYVLRKGQDSGKHVKNVKRLLVIPHRQLGLFIRKEEAAGGLKFQEFKVYRTDSRTSKIGDDYTPMKKWTREEIEAEEIKIEPYEYDEIIPLGISYEEQEAFFQEHPGAQWGGPQDNKQSNDSTESADAAAPAGKAGSAPEGDEDIPF